MKAPAPYKFLPPELAESLGRLGLTVRRPVVGTLQGLHRSPHLGSSVEFEEYREYVPGDSVQLIDWAVYARSDQYVIRRFREETNLRAYFLLDVSQSMDFREEGRWTKMEYACFLAAGLMYILLNQGDAAGLITFDGKVRQVFQPTRSFEGLRPILLHLEDIRPAGRSDIEAALHDTAELLRPRSMVVVISDLLEKPERILHGLRHLHHYGHDITVFHVLDAAEITLSTTGVTEFKELESGRRMVVEVDEVRQAYTLEVEHYLEELRRGCADGLAHYLLADTRNAVETAVQGRASRV